ncbi:MAG TPA: non-homologous end-joining DNA ligase [Pyrinomonadaceae bacterium]|nr:non-homologous end-joining DNA ligase [Pyrinomonadaceae bacterium]
MVSLKSLPVANLGFVEPMLAKLTNRLPEGENWLYEIKLDGYRALVIKRNGAVTVYSRRGNNLNSRFNRIARSFDFLPDDTMIDGEIVAIDKNGQPSFNALQNYRSQTQPLYFYVFDVLAYRGKDVRKLALRDRRKLLEADVLRSMREPVRLSAVFSARAKDLIAAAKKEGLEGVVAKRVESTYESGERSGAWVKYKTDKGQEFVIGGYKPGTHGFEYLLAGYYEGKNLIFVAKVKNGFTPVLRRKVAERFKKLETNVCPFANLPESRSARRGEPLTAEVMKQMQWLKPKLVAHIEYTEWTEANHLRHSRFVALRDDKPAPEVVREV